MDSINQDQTHQDLAAEAAVKKIQELVDRSPTCFFCTALATGESAGSRPMRVLKADDHGHLWFLSASDSHQNLELAQASAVELYFQGSTHTDFLHLSGHASISEDKAKIKELWNPVLRTWFTGGLDDPRITVIEFTPHEGYYWDTKHGAVVSTAKIFVGALLGKTLDDSIEGKLRV